MTANPVMAVKRPPAVTFVQTAHAHRQNADDAPLMTSLWCRPVSQPLLAITNIDRES